MKTILRFLKYIVLTISGVFIIEVLINFITYSVIISTFSLTTYILIAITTIIIVFLTKKYKDISFRFSQDENSLDKLTKLLQSNNYALKSQSSNSEVYVNKNFFVRLNYAFDDKVNIKIDKDYFEVSLYKINRLTKKIEQLNIELNKSATKQPLEKI